MSKREKGRMEKAPATRRKDGLIRVRLIHELWLLGSVFQISQWIFRMSGIA